MSLAPCLLSPPPPHRSSEPNDSLKGTYSSCPHLPNSFFLVLQSKNLPPSSAKGVASLPFPPEFWMGLSMDTCPQLSSLTSAPTHVLLTPHGQSQSHCPLSKPFLHRDHLPHLQGRGHRAKCSCSRVVPPTPGLSLSSALSIWAAPGKSPHCSEPQFPLSLLGVNNST